jgi:hypothetical protein
VTTGPEPTRRRATTPSGHFPPRWESTTGDDV